MNVIIANDFASVRGGADQVAIAEALALAQKGHAVIFFAAIGPVGEQLLKQPNLSVHCLGGNDILNDPHRLRAFYRGLWNGEVALALSKLLDKTKQGETVAHIHGWTKGLTSSIFPLLNRRKVPTVVTMHDYFCACPNGAFYDFSEGQICQRTAMGAACMFRQCDRRNYGHKLWRVLRQQVQKSRGGFPGDLKHAVVISKLSEAKLSPYLPENIQLHRVGNPIDVKKSERVDVAANRQFTFVGRLTREKAPHHLAQAAASLNVSICFVGDGEMRERIISQKPDAEITGWQTKSQVQQHLRKARALIFPSIWYEAQPLVIGEAAAMGIAAVVSDGCAAAEFVIDGETGLHFRSGDVQDLQTKLKILEDDSLVDRLGHNAYNRFWETPPTLQRHAEDLEDVYKQMLQ